MNWDQVAGKWKQMKGVIKERDWERTRRQEDEAEERRRIA